ncbi:MAG: hypothetical protein GW763_10460 [Paraglaciecola sp.]|nr:hypothetical protein [Paraglaciecola sp.]NCT48390.1 hypothetical protein [Paraglaciecola sp.]
MKTRILSLSWLLSSFFAVAVQASPIFQNFGQFDPYTGGGSGIPNDAVAWSQFDFGQQTLTMALTATERYCTDPVANDGAGTFTAMAGINAVNCSNAATTPGANWNFGLYLAIDGNITFSDFFADLAQANQLLILRFNYDTDPSAAISFGTIDIAAWALAEAGDSNVFQTSQNMHFSWLDNPLYVVPPAIDFDPNSAGSYNLRMTASTMVEDGAGNPNSIAVLLESLAIDVNVVSTDVSAPANIGLFSLALLGGALLRRRQLKVK